MIITKQTMPLLMFTYVSLHICHRILQGLAMRRSGALLSPGGLVMCFQLVGYFWPK